MSIYYLSWIVAGSVIFFARRGLRYLHTSSRRVQSRSFANWFENVHLTAGSAIALLDLGSNPPLLVPPLALSLVAAVVLVVIAREEDPCKLASSRSK